MAIQDGDIGKSQKSDGSKARWTFLGLRTWLESFFLKNNGDTMNGTLQVISSGSTRLNRSDLDTGSGSILTFIAGDGSGSNGSLGISTLNNAVTGYVWSANGSVVLEYDDTEINCRGSILRNISQPTSVNHLGAMTHVFPVAVATSALPAPNNNTVAKVRITTDNGLVYVYSGAWRRASDNGLAV